MKKMNFTSAIRETSFQKVRSTLWNLWVKYFRFLLILLILLAIIFVVRVWYKNLYQLDKVEGDRAMQLIERTKEVEFDEQSFNRVNESVEARRQEMTIDVEEVNDVFFPNQLPAQAENQKESVSEKEIIDVQPEDDQVINTENPVTAEEEIVEQEAVEANVDEDVEVSSEVVDSPSEEVVDPVDEDVLESQ